MNSGISRRNIVFGASAAVGLAAFSGSLKASAHNSTVERTFKKAEPPAWLLAFWKEIDDKTWGDGFNCFRADARANLGVGDWNGREEIRESLKKFIDSGFTAHHDIVEYWDGGQLKVFRGVVTMTPDDKSKPTVRPVMSHFFYMDPADHTKVIHWFGAVGPVQF